MVHPYNSPSILEPGFMFRLAVMADTDTVTLGFMAWDSVSMATTIWPVRRDTLWKGTTGARRTLLTVPAAEACWWWAERAVLGVLEGALVLLVGDERGEGEEEEDKEEEQGALTEPSVAQKLGRTLVM